MVVGFLSRRSQVRFLPGVPKTRPRERERWPPGEREKAGCKHDCNHSPAALRRPLVRPDVAATTFPSAVTAPGVGAFAAFGSSW